MSIDMRIALAVLIATAATDAAYVMFTSAVVAHRPVHAANWSGIWYMLSSFAVINYTNNWVYIFFAVIGSWIGAYVTLRYFRRKPTNPPGPLKPMA